MALPSHAPTSQGRESQDPSIYPLSPEGRQWPGLGWPRSWRASAALVNVYTSERRCLPSSAGQSPALLPPPSSGQICCSRQRRGESEPWRLATYRPHPAGVSWDPLCSSARHCLGSLPSGCSHSEIPSLAEIQGNGQRGGQWTKCFGGGNSIGEGTAEARATGRKSTGHTCRGVTQYPARHQTLLFVSCLHLILTTTWSIEVRIHKALQIRKLRYREVT